MFHLRNLSGEQARALSLLVELEAGWENLRVEPPLVEEPTKQAAKVKELHQRQKAYDTFRTKLVAYNKGFRPPHVPEMLLNTADRLGAWCRWVTDLLRAAHQDSQRDSQASYPLQLIDKAYRCADWLAAKRKVERVARTTQPRDIQAAIQELENLAQWCESLAPTMSPSRLAG